MRAIFASEEAIRKKYWEPLKKSTENTLSLMDDYIKNPPQTPEEKEKRLEGITNSTSQTVKEAVIAYNDAQSVMKDPKASPEEKQKALGLASTAVIFCAAVMNIANATGNENVRNSVEKGFYSVSIPREMRKKIKEARKKFQESNGFVERASRTKDQDKTSGGPFLERIAIMADDAIARTQKTYRDVKQYLEKPNDSAEVVAKEVSDMTNRAVGGMRKLTTGLNQLLTSAQDSSSQSKGADENDFATDINAPRTPSSVSCHLAQHAHKEDETATYGYNMFNQLGRSA